MRTCGTLSYPTGCFDNSGWWIIDELVSRDVIYGVAKPSTSLVNPILSNRLKTRVDITIDEETALSLGLDFDRSTLDIDSHVTVSLTTPRIIQPAARNDRVDVCGYRWVQVCSSPSAIAYRALCDEHMLYCYIL